MFDSTRLRVPREEPGETSKRVLNPRLTPFTLFLYLVLRLFKKAFRLGQRASSFRRLNGGLYNEMS